MQMVPVTEQNDDTTTRTRQDPRTRKETDLDDSIIDLGHQRKQARPTTEPFRPLPEVIPLHEQVLQPLQDGPAVPAELQPAP